MFEISAAVLSGVMPAIFQNYKPPLLPRHRRAFVGPLW
jgi:hypothetical protein